MNLPTKITVARIALIPLMLVFFCLQEIFEYYYICLFLVFAIAACTDFIDGYLARKNNMVTDLGKFLDPVADKILVLAGLLIAFSINSMERYSGVICIVIILSREFIIGVFRQIAASKGSVLAADKLGKAKTMFTLFAIGFLLLAGARISSVSIVAIIGQVFYYIGNILFIIATVLTIVSGINYIVKNKSVLSNKLEQVKSDDVEQVESISNVEVEKNTMNKEENDE